MLKNLTIKARLIAVLSMLALLMIFIGVAGAYALGQSNHALQTVYEDRLVAMGQLDGVIRAVNRNQLVIAAAITGAPEGLPQAADTVEKNRAMANELWKAYAATALTPQEKAMADSFAAARAQFVKEALEPAIQAARAGDTATMTQLLHGKLDSHYQAVRSNLDALIKLQLQVGQQEFQHSQQAYEQFRLMVFLLLALGAGAAALVGWWLVRSITQPLEHAVRVAQAVAEGDLTQHITVHGNDETGRLLASLAAMNDSLSAIVGGVRVATDTIATASGQIAAGNLDLSARTEQQASSLEETASSMEELTSTVRQNADNAQQANQLAAAASAVATRGGATVVSVVQKMGAIHASSQKISDIIGVIDSIAFQTNILALNAAVEAARAGEQGRGFAVVATEVRNLAQRSASAAREIKDLINDSVAHVSDGSKLADEAGTTMEEVVTAVQRVRDIIDEIATASREQSSGIEQVNEAITQMDDVTQQNASLVEQAAAAAASMQEQSAGLSRAVSVFRTGRQALQAAPRPKASVTRLPTRRPALAANGGWEEF